VDGHPAGAPHRRDGQRLRPGSSDLTTLFGRSRAPLANDTSCGVGFAPLTELERIVLEVEHVLNDRAAQAKHPELGSDVKVMGVHHRDQVSLTVACALVDRHVESLAAYVARKSRAQELVTAAAARVSFGPVAVTLSAADDVRTGPPSDL
jgi:S-adenosylmethionine synthetase